MIQVARRARDIYCLGAHRGLYPTLTGAYRISRVNERHLFGSPHKGTVYQSLLT